MAIKPPTTFECYICTASAPNTGSWPPGWVLCIGFRAACPACVEGGRAVPINARPAEPEVEYLAA